MPTSFKGCLLTVRVVHQCKMSACMGVLLEGVSACHSFLYNCGRVQLWGRKVSANMQHLPMTGVCLQESSTLKRCLPPLQEASTYLLLACSVAGIGWGRREENWKCQVQSTHFYFPSLLLLWRAALCRLSAYEKSLCTRCVRYHWLESLLANRFYSCPFF